MPVVWEVYLVLCMLSEGTHALSLCVCVCVSLSPSLSIYLSIHLSLSLSLCLSLSVSLSHTHTGHFPSPRRNLTASLWGSSYSTPSGPSLRSLPRRSRGLVSDHNLKNQEQRIKKYSSYFMI